LSKEWILQKERSNSFTLKLICWIALNSSRSFSRLFLYPITLYFLLTSPRVYKASRNYLKRVLGYKIGVWQVAKHIHCFSATILDRVYFLTDQDHILHITIHGKEILDRKVKNKEGCILLGSHIGSFEVLRSLAINKMDLPVKILMQQDHNQMITKVLEALNPTVAKSVINITGPNALLRVKECIDQGYMVGILGDRIIGKEDAISCNLLGDTASFPVAPIKLAAVLEVPVILFFGIYQGGNRYEIYFEKLTEKIDTARQNRDVKVNELTHKYVEHIEQYLKIAPLNWFNFYDFWEDEKPH
jgi:predicted LPLAT superfamily acyltransferase